MRKIFFLFIALCTVLPVLAQTSKPSLQAQLREASSDSVRLHFLLELSNYYRLRKPDSSLIYARQSEELALQLNDTRSRIRSLLIRGMLAHRQSEEELAIQLFHQSAGLSRKNSLQDLRGAARQNLALVYKRIGSRDSAFYYFTLAEQDFTEGGNAYENWHIYFGLSELYDSQGQRAEAEAFMIKALEVTQTGNSRMDQGFMLFHLAERYFMAENYERLAEIQQIWEDLQQDSHSAMEILEHPGHFSMAKFFLPDDTTTLRRIESAYQHYLKNGNTFMAGWSLENKGLYLEAEGQITAAQNAYEQALDLFKSAGAHLRRGMALQQLYQLHKAQGATTKALSTLEAFRALSDSLNTAEAEAHLRELQIAYKTSQKEQELQIQSLEVQQKTQQRNWLIGVVILLLLLGISVSTGLISRIRTQQRLADQSALLNKQKIRQLEQQQKILAFDAMLQGQEKERTRIAQDLHDGLGGLLTSVKAHFGQYTEVPKEALQRQTQALIDESCVEVRRISHNLMPRTLALSGLKEAIEDLAIQLKQSGLQVDLEIMGDLSDLSERQQLTLYRMLQEGVNNLLKHAQAKNVLLQVLRHQNELTVILEDDGKGFDLSTVNTEYALGLKGLRSRAKFLNGDLDIDTVPGQGTTINFQMKVTQQLNPTVAI